MSKEENKPSTSLAQRLGASVGWVVGILGVGSAIVTNWGAGRSNAFVVEVVFGVFSGFVAYTVFWGVGIWVLWLRGAEYQAELKKIFPTIWATLIFGSLFGIAAWKLWGR
jgi:hypothetical protein